MKTNEELLKFYGVELNKKYIITEKSDIALACADSGEKFKIFIDNLGSERPRVWFENGLSYHLHVLNDLSYKPCPEEVLDKAEKEYLSAVIKPFRNKYTISIAKLNSIDNDGNVFERISILMMGKYTGYTTTFPMFRGGTMYKGMKVHKEYTLEELGL